MILLTSTVLRLVGGAFLMADEDGNDSLVLVDGSSTSLSANQVAAVEIFSTPRTFKSGVNALDRRMPTIDRVELVSIVTELVEHGIITPLPSESDSEKNARPRGMFGCPTLSLEQATTGQAEHVVFLGMPYDQGVTGREGTKNGPAYLRRCSRTAFEYITRNGSPTGWWSTEYQARILDGVRLCDIGNVTCSGTARNGPAFDRLYEIHSTLLRARRFPITIGGDHSISLPLITSTATCRGKIGVLHFDAHSDIGQQQDMGDWKKNGTHGNFMSWVAANPSVECIYQLGIRQFLPDACAVHPKVKVIPCRTILGELERLAETIPKSLPYYVTFDVDCLDPTVMASTGTPIPGGFRYEDVVKIFRTLLPHIEVAAFDFVEMIGSPSPPNPLDGLTVSYLLFQALSCIFQPGAKTLATLLRTSDG